LFKQTEPLLGLLGFAIEAIAQDYIVIKAKLDNVMQPKDAGDVVLDCVHSIACAALIDKAATMAGVPPGAVSAGFALVPRFESVGEETHIKFALPAGYGYCRSQIQTISVVPATGDRASLMSVTPEEDGVRVYTWTPRQGFGGGRSWVEANFTIVGVREDIAYEKRNSGTCRGYGVEIINCRGASGVNNGRPACGTISD